MTLEDVCGLCGYTATSTADEGTAYCIVCELRGELAGLRTERDRYRDKADDYEALEAENVRLRAALEEHREAAQLGDPEEGPRSGSYGAVTGRIQTLTSRNSLRFVVYDHLHDRAVSCYLVEGGQDMMREMWDRVATVEGWVSRDPESGRPLTVRRVSNVKALSEAEPDAYKRARGALGPRIVAQIPELPQPDGTKGRTT